MTIKKLSRMPYATAHVEIDDDGNINLFSYVTLVVTIDKDGWLTCTGTYSPTTRKHISAFMREYVTYPNGNCGEYQTAKEAYLRGFDFNVNTGEIRFHKEIDGR